MIDIQLDEPSRKLILYPIINNDYAIRVKLSAPASILSNNFPSIENGIVTIFENNVPLDTVNIDKTGNGYSNVIPTPGKTYLFSANASGYPTANCVAMLPNPVQELLIDTTYSVFFEFQKNLCIHLKIKDDPSIKNFYKTKIFIKRKLTTTITRQVGQGYLIYDSSYVSISKPELYSNIPDHGFIKTWNGKFLLVEDIIDITEGSGFKYNFGKDIYFQGREFYFSDDFLNGKEILINLIVGGPIHSNNKEKYIIEVSSISEDFYNGAKSYARYGTRENSDLPYSEEVSIFSSVQGGYGFPVSANTLIDSSFVMLRY